MDKNNKQPRAAVLFNKIHLSGRLTSFFCPAQKLNFSALSVALAFLLVIPLINVGQISNTNSAQNTNQNRANSVNPPAATNNNSTGETNQTGESENNPSTDGGKSKPDFRDEVVVDQVYNLQYKESESPYKRSAGLNDIIVVRVQDLEKLIQRSKCIGVAVPCEAKDIVLFIDGREIKGLQPESGAPKLDSIPAAASGNANQTGNKTPATTTTNGELRFHLQRITDSSDSDDDNSEHWADLLGLRFDAPFNQERQVEVSVGLADDYPVSTRVKTDAQKQENQFSLIRFRPWWLLIWGIITGLIIGGLIWLAIKSDLLRDRHPVLWNQKKPYSLSAFQAAWWFALVFLSFIFIWLVTGQYDLSPTALILLSIGLGAALGARVIDTNKRNTTGETQPNADKLNLLLSDKQKIEADVTRLVNAHPRDGEPLITKRAEYESKILEIRKDFPYAIGPAHENFLTDILSDVNGINFHRFQLFVWTIILGLFFIISALGRLAMPQFNETLLALMGISAGTYLGFKIPENNNVPTPINSPGNGNGSDAGGDGQSSDANNPSSANRTTGNSTEETTTTSSTTSSAENQTTDEAGEDTV